MLRWGLCAGVQCFWEGGKGRRGGRERVGVQLELLSCLWWINPRAPGGYCQCVEMAVEFSGSVSN